MDPGQRACRKSLCGPPVPPSALMPALILTMVHWMDDFDWTAVAAFIGLWLKGGRDDPTSFRCVVFWPCTCCMISVTCMAWPCTRCILVQRVGPSSILFSPVSLAGASCQVADFFCACATLRNRQRCLICIIIITTPVTAICFSRSTLITIPLPRNSLFGLTSQRIQAPVTDVSLHMRPNFSVVDSGKARGIDLITTV